jgi:polyferredoxin
MSDNPDDHKPMRPVIWARLLLLVPFVAMLWVSSYNVAEPTIGGVPFFYWYQLGWIAISAVMIGFVYWLER